MSRYDDPPPPAPLITPVRVAIVVAVVLGTMLLAYLLAFGAFGKILQALGLYQPPSLGQAPAPNTPGPLTIAGQNMADLKVVILGLHQALGELPPSLQRLQEADASIVVVDPWGHPYRLNFTPDRRRCWISCDGPDGLPDTPDDLITAKIP